MSLVSGRCPNPPGFARSLSLQRDSCIWPVGRVLESRYWLVGCCFWFCVVAVHSARFKLIRALPCPNHCACVPDLWFKETSVWGWVAGVWSQGFDVVLCMGSCVVCKFERWEDLEHNLQTTWPVISNKQTVTHL